MPGLVALLTPKYDKLVAQNITEMTESINQEDFYKKDVFDNASFPFVASRVHLNIVNKESQPIYNEDNTVLIMMDGELHAHKGLKEKLRSAGHNLRTKSDAELLLHLYEEMGEAFVHDLNGWFLALIYDIKQRKTLIVNDCFGICQAYYTQHNDTFIIASEVKGLLKYKQITYSLNKEKFPEYFLYDAILNDETFFKEIHRLPPASIWSYKDGTVSTKQYFDISRLRENASLSKTEFNEEASRIFRKVIAGYASGNGVGLSLTGGWDTRAILALISHLGYSLPCYTWCGPYRDSLDVKTAKKLANILGQEYHVFNINKDFFENFSDYAYKTIYASDGSADIFKSHVIYLDGLVRTLAPIRLSGKYGSQMSRNFFLHEPKLDKRIFSEQFLHDTGDLHQYIHPFEGLESIFDVLRWLWPNGFLALERCQSILRCPYLDKELVTFLFKAPKSYLQGSIVQKFIIKKNCPSLAGLPSDKGAYIKSEYTLKNIKLSSLSLIYEYLTKLDKAYLHPNVPHIFSRLDPFMKSTRLERVFLGYCNLASYRRWIKNELRDFTEGILLEELTLSRPYLNPNIVKKMASDHFSNRANYMREIGKIISFEIWHRLFVD